MLVHVPQFTPLCGLMSQDPLLIRDKLFTGIDSDYNVVDMGIVSEVIAELENYHITKEALEATRLGKHINDLRRKTSDKLLANRTKSLVKKWRALLSDTGPPPGGGNHNNNSLAATNGNTAARLNAPVAVVSPELPRSNNMSPGLPLRNNISPGLRSNISPGLRSTISPGMRSNISPGLPMRPGSISTLSGGIRSARASPSLSRSATPRVSPATVTISSSGSSPNNSRPTSPQPVFRPINPPSTSLPNSRSPSPDIEIIEEVVKTPRLVAKRMRRDDSDIQLLDSKRQKLDFGHQTPGLNGFDGTACDGAVPTSDKAGLGNRPKLNNTPRDKQNILNKQISMAKRSGKVKTTMELIENLGIEPDQDAAAVVGGPPPSLPHHHPTVKNLVPDENKEELMNRFFQSQTAAPGEQQEEDDEEDDDDDSAVEIISRPGTAASSSTNSGGAASQMSSRVNTPAPPPPAARQTVEEVLAQLEPIDPAAILAEWEARQEEEEVEIEGLIPVFKPKKEITEELIKDLNEGQLEHIGGVRDHNGEFKEWHEMVSKETLSGEMLHILPYSVID